MVVLRFMVTTPKGSPRLRFLSYRPRGSPRPVSPGNPSAPIVRPCPHAQPGWPSSLVHSYQSRAADHPERACRESLAIPRQVAKRVAKCNHDGLAVRACKRDLQVAAVFNLTKKLAVLVAKRMHHVTAQIRKSYAHILAGNSRITQVQELPGNHEIVAAGFGFDLQVNLKRVRAIEHLP